MPVVKLDTLLRFLLKEEALAPEASKNSSLGQYLFAPERNDTPIPQEPNTALENSLLKDLGRFYNTGGTWALDKSLVKLLKLSKQGKYSKLLKPPSGLAYRFIGNLKPEDASSLFLNNYPVEEILSKPNQAFRVSPVGIIKNPAIKSSMGTLNTKLSSWTVAPSEPHFDAFTATGPGHVAVVLVANIQANNFFMNPENLSNSLANGMSLPQSAIEKEQEVIAYGPVNVIDAAAIYVMTTDEEETHEKIIDDLPKIKISGKGRTLVEPNSKKDNLFLAPHIFAKQLEYVERVIEEHATPDIQRTMATSNQLLHLKQLAQEGCTIQAGSFKERTVINTAHDALYVLFDELRDANPYEHDINIHAELIYALRLTKNGDG